ncbi:hypothetical protein NIES4075_02480 [Tolypothrix sp. NIES-4075]|uniref:hypothetical protein n=1 Tax=Tolypothrix sp. NIES-4075 TaxID=2005459 RepID=UPI000B5C9FCB|nr:hypothetical protein [Tolypothrix sp. NIES-4075]GAX39296.1 hypothetical protein NIES4075_02480 [Tolypothrix sp. NIES-4075]
MPYSQFNIESIRVNFNITLIEKVSKFADVAEISYSDYLVETLRFNTPIALAINSEKSRSEMIIAPILLELKRLYPEKVSLFSGKDFTVDIEKGLNGFCDFLISRSPEQLIITSPVIAVVEAKNENIEAGLGQCMAEMIASQIFNQQKGKQVTKILGVVTTGSSWKFMQLKETTIEVDLNEYFLNQVGKILGILSLGLEER